MKRILSFFIILALLFCISGCSNDKDDAQKYAKMAYEYLQEKANLKLNFDNVNIYATSHAEKDYSYYSHFDNKDITEYKDIVGVVLFDAIDNDVSDCVVFISKKAASKYEDGNKDWGLFKIYMSSTKQQVDKYIDSSYSGDYAEAVKAQMWKDTEAKNKAYIPTEKELKNWVKISPESLK